MNDPINAGGLLAVLLALIVIGIAICLSRDDFDARCEKAGGTAIHTKSRDYCVRGVIDLKGK